MVTSRNLAVIHWNYLDKLIASYIITMVVAAVSQVGFCMNMWPPRQGRAGRRKIWSVKDF